MMRLSENAQRAMEAIKLVEGNFSAKTLSEKSGTKVSPQTLSSLARKGVLTKIEGTSPVEYRLLGEFEAHQVSGTQATANRYAQYKLLIENKVKRLVGTEAPPNHTYMATLSGKYIEIIKYDNKGKNFPKIQCVFLSKEVDDAKAFQQAWEETIGFIKLVIM